MKMQDVVEVNLHGVQKESVREQLSLAHDKHAIEEFASLQDSLHLQRILPEFMGSREAFRIRPSKGREKFNPAAPAKIGWRERLSLYGLVRPMNKVMKAQAPYGKASSSKAKVVKRRTKRRTPRIAPRAESPQPAIQPYRFRAKGWEVSLRANRRGEFIVSRERDDSEEGELRAFTSLFPAVELYVQWCNWAKHLPVNNRPM